jgi:hypothetical protein
VTEGGAFDLLRGLGRLYLGPSAVYPSAGMRNIPGLYHANHTRALCRNRAMGRTHCSVLGRNFVQRLEVMLLKKMRVAGVRGSFEVIDGTCA